MKIIFSFIGFYLIVSNLFGQEPSFEWAKQIGGISTEYHGAIALDESKNIFMLGNFTGSVDFNPGIGVNNLLSTGNFDVCITKLDSGGNYLWAKQIGGGLLDFGFNLLLDGANNIYINGYVNGVADLDPGNGTFLTTGTGLTAFIIKLNSNGDFIWAKEFKSNSTFTIFQVYFNAMVLAKDCGILAAGQYGGSVDFNPGAGVANSTSLGSLDGFLLKLDSSGNYVWSKSLGSINDDKIISLATDTIGNIYTAGTFINTVDFNFSGAVFNMSAIGGIDVFFQKLDLNADLIWTKKMSGIGNEYISAITLDNSKNIYATGRFEGTVDFDPGTVTTYNLTSSNGSDDIYIAKLDNNGNFKYAKRKGDTLPDFAFNIKTDDLGNVYVLGQFNGIVNFNTTGNPKTFTSSNGSDIFLLKLDSLGGYYWLQQTNSSSSGERATAIAFDEQENIYISGNFSGTMDANSGSGVSNLVGFGSDDIYLQKLSQLNANTQYCGGTTTLTSCPGSFDDGSGSGSYGNYQNCSWLLQPTGAATINLSFTAFDIESGYDYLKIYNGSSASAPLIGTYTGSTIPQNIISSGSSLFITFTTDGSGVYPGFQINFTCNTPTPPITNFSSNVQNIVIGNSLNFNDSSLNNITAWKWTFTGASPATSSIKNPINITYNTAGCFPVTLISYNAFGSDTLTKTCYVNVAVPTPCSELFISEYIEGTSLNKVVELFNSSAVAINLSLYQLKLYSNGSTTPNSTMNLNGTLPALSTYIISNSGANAAILALANITNNALCVFNGDDAIVLYKNGVAIDAIGIIGDYSVWNVPGGSTLDRTLVRKSIVSFPSTNWAVVQNQWNALPVNDISNLDQHTSNCQPNASFTYLPSPACENNLITFTNTSTNSNAYQWSFQGGTPVSSTLTNPVVQFTGTGLKTVTLIATNGLFVDSSAVQINIGVLPTATITASGSVSFCAGGNVTFTANSGNGLTYQWQKNLVDIPNATTINYTANVAGNYSVIVADSFGCLATSASLLVTIYAKPKATLIASGTTFICANDSVQLIANTGNNFIYQWRKNNAVIPNAASSSYYAKLAGSYKVTVTNSNGCSKTSSTISVSINYPEAIITPQGPTTVCNGSGVTLKANTGTGYTYQWRKGTNIISGAIDSIYTAFVSGTYKVAVTSSCGVVSSPGLAVVINPVPTVQITASGSTSICNSDSITLTTTSGTGLLYQWLKNGIAINLQNASSIKTSAAGSYTVLVTNSFGCTALSNTIAVTVSSVAANITANGPTTFCNGDSVKLTANAGANLSYQWLKSNLIIIGANALSYTVKTAGNYKVRVTNTISNCVNTSTNVQVVTNCRLKNDEAFFEASVSPNPFNDFVTLDVMSDNDLPVSVKIVNAEGKVLINKVYTDFENITLGHNLVAGFYIVNIKQGDSFKTFRIVKL